jgi:hypothetical protein
MRRPGDCRGDIMQEINSLTQLTISPRGWGSQGSETERNFINILLI